MRACASERVSMWVLVFACASFRCFYGLGIFHLQVPEQFRILLRRVPTQSVQVLGRVTVQFVFRCFGFVISYDVFGIRWFSRFLDGRAISAVLRVKFFRNCHVGFPSVCKISSV